MNDRYVQKINFYTAKIRDQKKQQEQSKSKEKNSIIKFPNDKSSMTLSDQASTKDIETAEDFLDALPSACYNSDYITSLDGSIVIRVRCWGKKGTDER